MSLSSLSDFVYCLISIRIRIDQNLNSNHGYIRPFHEDLSRRAVHSSPETLQACDGMCSFLSLFSFPCVQTKVVLGSVSTFCPTKSNYCLSWLTIPSFYFTHLNPIS